MSVSEILAAKVAFQRMHPDRILYKEIERPRGNAADRKRYLRAIIRANPDPHVRLVALGDNIAGQQTIEIPPLP